MNTEDLVEELQKVKAAYPSLSVLEVIELMKLKEMMRVR